MTQQEKFSYIKDNDELMELYRKAIDAVGMVWSKTGPKIGKRKVGMHKYTNAQKTIAARIYDEHFKL